MKIYRMVIIGLKIKLQTEKVKKIKGTSKVVLHKNEASYYLNELNWMKKNREILFLDKKITNRCFEKLKTILLDNIKKQYKEVKNTRLEKL